MATLILDFYCMCLFVPDERDGSVHVLMPAMHGPGNGGHPAHHDGHAHGHGLEGAGAHEDPRGDQAHREHQAVRSEAGEHGGSGHESGRAGEVRAGLAPEKHVVRMLHPSFTATHPLGRPMEGLSLVLDGQGPANIILNSARPGEELPDLSTISGKRVARSFLSEAPKGLSSRVTLRAGAVTERRSDNYEWTLGGRTKLRLANHVTWVIPNVPDTLTWHSIGDAASPPIDSLRDLKPEANDLYRISIHHETERTLKGGKLTVPEMQHHFTAFYDLLGVKLPDEPQKRKFFIPDREGGAGGAVMCRSAMAQLEQ